MNAMSPHTLCVSDCLCVCLCACLTVCVCLSVYQQAVLKVVDPYVLEAISAGLPGTGAGAGAAPQGCNAEEERLWNTTHAALKNKEVSSVSITLFLYLTVTAAITATV